MHLCDTVAGSVTHTIHIQTYMYNDVELPLLIIYNQMNNKKWINYQGLKCAKKEARS